MATYLLSGTVRSGGVGVSGATITLTGATSGSATTDANGYYVFPACNAGEHLIVPSKSTYGFQPNTYTVVLNDTTTTNYALVGQDFVMVSLTTTYDLKLGTRGDDHWLDILNYNFTLLNEIFGWSHFNSVKDGLVITKKDADEIYVDAGNLLIKDSHYYLASQLTIQISNPVASTVYYVYATAPPSGLTLSTNEISISSTAPSYNASYSEYYSGNSRLIGILKTDASAEIDWVASDSDFNLDSGIANNELLVYQVDASSVPYIDGYAIPDPLTLAKGGTNANLAPTDHCLYGWDNTDNVVKTFIVGSGLAYDHATHTLNNDLRLNVSVVGTQSSNYSMTTADVCKSLTVDTHISDVTITLPAGADDGQWITIIRKVTAPNNNLIIRADAHPGGDYIEGQSSTGGAIFHPGIYSEEDGANITLHWVDGDDTWIIESAIGTWLYYDEG